MMIVTPSYGGAALIMIRTCNGITMEFRNFGSSGKWAPRCCVIIWDSERYPNAVAGAIVPVALSAPHKVSTAEDLSTIDKVVVLLAAGSTSWLLQGPWRPSSHLRFSHSSDVPVCHLCLRIVTVRGVHGRRR